MKCPYCGKSIKIIITNSEEDETLKEKVIQKEKEIWRPWDDYSEIWDNSTFIYYDDYSEIWYNSTFIDYYITTT